MNATLPRHTIVGFFEQNDFRSQSLLRDLVKEFGRPSLFVLWHHYEPASPFSFTSLETYHRLAGPEVVEFIAQTYGLKQEQLASAVEGYPVLLKILLLLYARKFLGLDYCVMTDNDLVFLEPISEVVDLSARRIPFLIQESGAADTLPSVREFIAGPLGKTIRYRPPTKGGGYNVGLCGIDLRVFDSLAGPQLAALLELFRGIPEWWKEQAFLVSMIFTSPGTVHTFDNERYYFLPFDEFHYREKSKVYHAICTRDKEGVDVLHSLRVGKLNARRYLTLLDYIRGNQCGRMLEIGVWRGDTSELLVLNSRNKQLEYHGIDVFEGTSGELLAKEVSLKADSLADVRSRLEKVSRSVHLHKGLSGEVFGALAAQKTGFDMIWIDGGHSYQTVREDFRSYRQLLNEGGIIFFDDYTEDPYLPDVKRFIDSELRTDPSLVVTIHEAYVDRYRGHDYKVVSVRRAAGSPEQSGPPSDAPFAPPLPGSGFFHRLLAGEPESDPTAPREGLGKALLAEAQPYLARKACLTYAEHLVKVAQPLLSAAGRMAAGKLLLAHNVLLELVLELFDQAAQAGDSNPELADLRAACLLQRGLGASCLVERGQFMEAESAVLAALEGHPNDDRLRKILAELDRIAQGPAPAAVGGTEDFWGHYHWGVFLRHRGRLAESQTQLEKALALRPGDEGAVFQLRETLKTAVRQAFDTKHYDQALAPLDAFPERQKDAEWHYLRAQALHWQGQEPGAARRHYDLALQLGHDEFWVRALRGRLARETGDFEAARADLVRALELHPDDAEVKNDLAAAQTGLAALPGPKSAAKPAAAAKRPGPSLLRRARKRALIFWPYCALPPQSGAHAVSLSDFSAFKEMGFDLALYGTTLFSDNPWEPLGRADVQEMLGARVYYHTRTPADHEYLRQQERLDPGSWTRYTPPSLLEHFRQVFAREEPDLVLINYPRWGRLARGEAFRSAVRVMRSHDVLTANEQMLRALSPLLCFPIDPARADPRMLEETFFAGQTTPAQGNAEEEIGAYGDYDAIACLTEDDVKAIRAQVPARPVCLVPTCAPQAKALANTYSEGAILAISDYALNYQAYLYFAARVLPLVRRQMPSFELTVVGKACQKLAPTPGVRALGFVLDLAPLYAKARFAVCPVIGGTGIQVKIVEAMANGLPVVALANVAGKVPLRHGVNGFVAENAAAFAQYAVQLGRDPRLCRKLGRAARATIEAEFSRPKRLAAWEAVIRSAEERWAAEPEKQASTAGERLVPIANQPVAIAPRTGDLRSDGRAPGAVSAAPAPAPRGQSSPSHRVKLPRSWPKVSIITPSFDCGQYLRSCLESVLGQGYPNFEHIVIDGGSKDGTVEILKSYSHVRWISEPDKGEANALNKGLRLATGDIIGWLNADDFYAEGTLQAVAGFLDPSAGRHVVYGKTLMLGEGDRPTGLRIPIVPVNLYTLMRWYRHLQIYQPSMFLAGCVVEKVGAFREDLAYSVDLDYWIRIARQGFSFHYLDRILAQMRLLRAGGKTSHTYAAKERDWLAACLPALQSLPAPEVRAFWKDYYAHRLGSAQLYDGAPLVEPPDGPAAGGLFLAALDAGRLGDFVPVLEAAVRRFPKAEDFRWLLGEGLAQAGRSEESLRVFSATARPAPAKAAPNRRALVFFPHNFHPVRTGAHRRCLSVLQGLQALGYQVELVSSDLFSDQPWSEASLQAIESDYAIKVRLYRGTTADQQFIQQAQAAGWLWEAHVPPSLRSFFEGVYQSLQPEVVVINYAFWADLVTDPVFAPALRLIEMHDLATLSLARSQVANHFLPQPPFTMAKTDPRFLQEDFFENLNLAALPEEYARYDRFDSVVAISPTEAELVQQRVHHAGVHYLPVALPVEDLDNTHTGAPLLVISNNYFNIQGYLFFSKEILPRLRKEIPDFTVDVVGNVCDRLEAVPGMNRLGYVEDLRSAYRTARFALCPLLCGTGQQVKVAEAMAYGLPVVVMRQVAKSSPVKHGVNGLVAKDAAEFAQSVLRLFRDPALCRRMGEAARAEMAALYSPAKFASWLEAAIETARLKRDQRLQRPCGPGPAPEPPAKPKTVSLNWSEMPGRAVAPAPREELPPAAAPRRVSAGPSAEPQSEPGCSVPGPAPALAQLDPKATAPAGTRGTKVMIDGVIFQLQRKSPAGISRVWTSLLHELARSELAKDIILLDRSNSAPAIAGIASRPGPAYDGQRFESDPLLLQELCDREQVGLFISTYYSYPELSHSMVMLHDMIPEVSGQDLSQPEWRAKAKAIAKACAYFCVSNATLADFRQLHPELGSRPVYLTPNAVGEEFRRAAEGEVAAFCAAHPIGKPYFLLVGHRTGYKNAQLFFRAFGSWNRRGDFEVVCAGGAPELEPSFHSLVHGRPCHVLALTNAELAAAYSGAAALVYPSRYEGFGLPVLEAQKCGCPVITGRNSSLPEVAGEAALLIGENDVAGLQAAMNQVLAPATRGQLVERGLENTRRFSWTRTAGALVEAIKTVRSQTARLELRRGEPLNTVERFAWGLARNHQQRAASELLSYTEMALNRRPPDLARMAQLEQRLSPALAGVHRVFPSLAEANGESDGLLCFFHGLALEHRQEPQPALRAYLQALNSPGCGQAGAFRVRLGLRLARVALEMGDARVCEQVLLACVLPIDPQNTEAHELLKRTRPGKPTGRAGVPPASQPRPSAGPAPAAPAGQSEAAAPPLAAPQAAAQGSPPAPADDLPAASRQSAEPLVSALVSAYNSERFMRGCLEDLERQTIADRLEIIVVDSASPQNERAIVEEFQKRHSNIVYLRTEARESVYAAWNRAVKAARGKYLTNANTDDRHRRDALEVLARTLEEHPEVTLVYADCLLTRTENETFETATVVNQCQWLDFNRADLLLKGCFVGPQPMWRGEVHKEHGYFDASFVSAGDYEFWLRIAQTRNFLHVRETLGLYLESPGSVEHANRERGAKEVAEARARYASGLLAGNTHGQPKGKACPEPRVQPGSAGASQPQAKAPLALPPCALVGHLGQARELCRRRKLPEAWTATLAALQVRPFHPEAYLLLAEIALAAGNSIVARQCAQHARQLAPEWKPAKKFLQGRVRGNAKPAWLVLPDAITVDASRLSVCLIAKNEEQFLPRCLASVRGLADQIVLVDTGSSDHTVELAKGHGAEVYHFAWCEDFSAARNAALAHVTGDWVLVLDADEELPPESQEPLRRLLRERSVIGWRLPLIDVGREEEGCSYVPRLFRNAPGLFYVGRVHEQVFSSLEVRRQQWGLDNRLGDAALRHHGYRPEVVKDRNKIERNLRLLERAVAEMPEEANLRMSYGLELARSDERERGVIEYYKALELMSAQPAALMVPELREMLLTQLSTQLMALKRWDELVRLLTSPLAQAGGLTASLHFALGLAHLELKQFGEAADQMRQCLAKRQQPALAPINKEIHQAGPRHCLALCLDQLGQTEPAAEQFRRAIQDDPQARPARLDYAGFLAAHGQPVEAINLFLALANEKPDDAQAWFRGGRVALSAPEFQEVALDWTAEAQRHLPQEPALAQQRAEALMLAGQCEAALPLWRRLALPAGQCGPAQALAALLLCETAAGQDVSPPPAHLEGAVSREFLNWYQRLVQFNARAALEELNRRVGALACVLPSAARLLAAALAEVREEVPA